MTEVILTREVDRSHERDFADLWSKFAAITGNSKDTLALVLPDAFHFEGNKLYKAGDWISLWAEVAKPATIQAIAQVSRVGAAQAILETRDASGSTTFWDVALSQIEGHDAILSVARDMTEAISYQMHLRRVAYHDGLTGLLNRVALMERLAEEISIATLRGESVTLLMLDLDNFKLINDTLGHCPSSEHLAQLAA